MNDSRHGTVAGYNRIPCRADCCRLAMARYKKRWEWDRANGRARITSTTGTRRRIEALNWLGWSRATIAAEMGMHPTNMTRLLRVDTMTVALADRFREVFERLCMTLPTGNQQAITNVRNRARRHGYLPPLAWDDIDDPNENPRGLRVETKADIDPVVVERILAGRVVPTTRAEREEVVRRWQGQGKPLKQLGEITGWKVERYYETGDRPGKDVA